jgi:hypothetical protein
MMGLAGDFPTPDHGPARGVEQPYMLHQPGNRSVTVGMRTHLIDNSVQI